ncbi:hypothetical protein HKCCE4037_18265 [Rhodobacterales bacterium HKCCE4037]|nr:hypothetical protein [Rhodobacterales bacterium HKCCE4037]
MTYHGSQSPLEHFNRKDIEKMKVIHFICRQAKNGFGLEGVNKVAGETDLWTSGTWTTDGYDPDEIVGGRIYFHERKSKPSGFGGEVLGYERKGERVVFNLRALADCRGVQWRGRNDVNAHCGYIVEVSV